MRFKVIPPRREVRPEPGVTFVLSQDRWNDYNFQTQYHLFLIQDGSVSNIGPVKILKRGQTPADGIQINEDFDALTSEYVSVGQSLDYYKHLAELGTKERDIVLNALRDVVMVPALEAEFSSEHGWTVSLFRDQSPSEIQQFLLLARSLVHSDYASIPSEDLKFSFQMAGLSEPLHFDFSKTPDPDPDAWFTPNVDTGLPDRLTVLIGKNGSGKSTVLARLARVAHASVHNRKAGVLEQLGQITPIDLGFPSIITVAYSAFDSFTLPGLRPQREEEPDERQQIIDDINRGKGRYIYCGLRDIAAELSLEIKREADSLAGTVNADRVKDTFLKSIAKLADEYARTLITVKENGKAQEFFRAMKLIATDSSFSFWDEDSAFDSLEGAAPVKTAEFEKLFHAWSTGQKIVAQVVASLAAYMVPRSLVLIDEPETHLHPPLLAALMHAFRYLLDRNRAFGIVATHSPVVVQESLARNVYIVNRQGELTRFFRPSIETFGENVGSLTTEVFGLNSEVTDFHRVLDRIMERYKTLEAIEALFSPHGLSLQARAYVISRLPESAMPNDVEAR